MDHGRRQARRSYAGTGEGSMTFTLSALVTLSILMALAWVIA